MAKGDHRKLGLHHVIQTFPLHLQEVTFPTHRDWSRLSPDMVMTPSSTPPTMQETSVWQLPASHRPSGLICSRVCSDTAKWLHCCQRHGGSTCVDAGKVQRQKVASGRDRGLAVSIIKRRWSEKSNPATEGLKALGAPPSLNQAFGKNHVIPCFQSLRMMEACAGDLKERENQIASSGMILLQGKEFKMSSLHSTVMTGRHGHECHRHKGRMSKMFTLDGGRSALFGPFPATSLCLLCL